MGLWIYSRYNFNYEGYVKQIRICGEFDMNIDDLNNNILSNRWKERYDKLSDEIKEKLNELDNSNISDYQLQVIKRKRLYPEIGDIFKVNPRDDIYFYGVVLNNHIHNINGDDLLLVLIFKQNIDIKGSIINGVKEDDLLLPPQIVGKEYWTRGFFIMLNTMMKF